MATGHLWTSVVALALAVPAGKGGMLASLESRRGRAADMSARAARSRHWRVPAAAAAAAVARSEEGVRRSFCLARPRLLTR